MERAAEFLIAARSDFDLGLYAPAAGNAVTAAIHASDVVTGLAAGIRSGSEAHGAAVTLLKEVGEKAAAAQLQQLLARKSAAQYDPAPTKRTTAEEALKRAERIVAAAKEKLGASQPSAD